jgi:predicted enzyme related to lactoylglutathione lyase
VKLTENGGAVLVEPFDVLDAGRMTVCSDPQGAVICAWQPNQMFGAVLVNDPGAWTWSELLSPDIDAVKGFYAGVFDWSLESSDEAGGEYYAWHVEGQRWEEEGIGGARPVSDYGLPSSAAQWVTHLAVPDAAAAASATTDAGGKVLVEPEEIPIGISGVLTDPQGALFGILEPTYPEVR